MEKYNSGIKFENDAVVVALTPLAAYELDKVGIKYKIIEEFYDEAQFVKEADLYLKDQLKWFSDFDELLFSVFPEAKVKNIKLATTFFYHIKLMIDAVILRSKILDAFIKKTNPKKIIYIVNDCKNNVINPDFPSFFNLATFSLSLKSQSLFFCLMPLFCKKYEIDFEPIVLNDVLGANNGNPKHRCVFRSVKGFRKYFNVKNYIKAWKGVFLRPSGMFRHKLLFLNSGYNNLEIMDEAQLAGCNIFYRDGNTIKVRRRGFNKVITYIKAHIDPETNVSTKKFMENIYDTDILRWINEQCKIDVRPIILSKLKSFISIFFPEFISLVNKYKTFYDENQIDMVFSSQLANVEEYAAIVACRYSKKTKSAYLPHGDVAFTSQWIDFGEYCPKFDIYFTNNSEAEESTRKRMQANSFKTKVYQSPVRYNIVPRLKSYGDNLAPHRIKKTLVYVPTMYQWDLAIWLDTKVPDTWYFMWQKELINLFCSRKDFNFVWKGIPSANQAFDPIPNMIRDKKFPNIKYATEPFVRWIKQTDMVLLDYPSTALYEAAISGLPVMSLFFAPYNRVRKSALGLFGKSLQPFYNFQDGIERVEKFLDSDAADYVVSMPTSSTSILETLNTFLEHGDKK